MREILQEIKNSFRLLSLEKGWDEGSAEPMNHKAYSRALEFVFKLINTVGETECPEINLCSDGSVDVSFRSNNKSSLLINFKEETIIWYGDDGNDGEKINHKQTELYNEDLFNWIKDKLLI